MIFAILFSLYLGFEFTEYKILPSTYFIEFEKGSFVYGIEGIMHYTERKTGYDSTGSKDKRRYYYFSLGINAGFKKSSEFKNYRYNFLFLLNPLYIFHGWQERRINKDTLGKTDYIKYKHYEHRILNPFMMGIEFPFKVKNLQFKLRMASSLFTIYYGRIDYEGYYSSGENKKLKSEEIGIKSKIGKAEILTSILLKIK